MIAVRHEPFMMLCYAPFRLTILNYFMNQAYAKLLSVYYLLIT